MLRFFAIGLVIFGIYGVLTGNTLAIIALIYGSIYFNMADIRELQDKVKKLEGPDKKETDQEKKLRELRGE